MTYSVVSISKARQMKDFLRLPFRVYGENPNWVPPFNSFVNKSAKTKEV